MTAITRYCRIRKNTILSNDEVIFQRELPWESWPDSAFSHLGIDYPKFYKMDVLSKLGFLAAELVLKDVVYPDGTLAIVLSNRSASLDTDQRYLRASRKVPSPGLFVYTLANIVTGEIAIRHRLRGENAFFVAETFDPDTLQTYTEQLLDEPFTSAVLAGWVEVLDEQHDVLLYLVEKRQDAGSILHTAEQINLLYRK